MEQRVELRAEDIIKELKGIIADQAQEIAILRVAISSSSVANSQNDSNPA